MQIEVQREIDAAQGGPLSMGSIERMSFYELAKKSYCVIQTGERRFYGCFVFKKGVIATRRGLARIASPRRSCGAACARDALHLSQ